MPEVLVWVLATLLILGLGAVCWAVGIYNQVEHARDIEPGCQCPDCLNGIPCGPELHRMSNEDAYERFKRHRNW